MHNAVIIAYAIQRKDGFLWLGGICHTRSQCVEAWTDGMWRSEKCKAWKAAKKAGVRIVKVRIEVVKQRL